MTSSILTTITRLFSLQPDLTISSTNWMELIEGLQKRGQYSRESGAFLLGNKKSRIVEKVVFYDSLDPEVSNKGFINFDGRFMAQLWQLCRELKLSVIADIHTHPGGAGQSLMDKQNPIIAEPGHLAMIIPNYARLPVNLSEVGLYRYKGKFNWETAQGSLFCPPLKVREGN